MKDDFKVKYSDNLMNFFRYLYSSIQLLEEVEQINCYSIKKAIEDFVKDKGESNESDEMEESEDDDIPDWVTESDSHGDSADNAGSEEPKSKKRGKKSAETVVNPAEEAEENTDIENLADEAIF